MNLGLVAVWFCGGIIHCVNPYHGLPVLGWRKMTGYDRLMLLLCQRMRLQSSLLQCLWLYIWTDVEVVLVNIPAQMEVSFVVHKEIFSCSWIVLIHPEKFISLLHLVPWVASQSEYCAGTRRSPFEVLCKRTNGWIQVGLDRWRTAVLGTSSDYPINCCCSLRCPPCLWLNVLSRDSASVHTKWVNVSDNCACARNVFLSYCPLY